MSIKAQVAERESIMTELKGMSARSKVLRARCKTLDDEISAYLERTNQPGLKFRGTIIRREEKEWRPMKKKSDRTASALELLRERGVNNPEKLLADLKDAQREEATERTVLKFKSTKK